MRAVPNVAAVASPGGPAPPSASPWRQLLPWLLLGLVLVQAWLRPPQPGPHDPVRRLAGPDDSAVVTLQGRLLSDPSSATAPPGCRVGLATADGSTDLSFAHCPPLREGWRVRVRGRLRQPRPAAHPLLAGPAERLARQGIWTQLRVEQLEVLARPPTPIADLRRAMAQRLMAAAGPERGGLLAALVLGSAVVPLPLGLRTAFRAAGLSHALAASGFHLAVLLGFTTAVGRPLGRPLRLALAGGAILLFLLLAGPQPSVLRAVLMGAIALVVLESGLRGRPLGILGVTLALLLVLRPDWLWDVGFQLSVAATAGLLLTARPLEEALRGRWPQWLAPGWAVPALAVPLAATLWTLPLQLLHFGAIPLYAVPANIAAGPLLTPLTLGAMALALVALVVPPLLGPLLLPVDLLARLLLAVANGFAALPMAQWPVGRPLPLLVLVLALALLGLVLPHRRMGWRRLAWFLLAGVVAVHLHLLMVDQLLLVHEAGAAAGRDLLVARHRGRAALISRSGDGFSCRQAAQLAAGLGVLRFDWLLLLDPVAMADPACWQRQAGVVLATGAAGPPLLAGQRLASAGLAVQALAMDSQALRLSLGDHRWLLLPDRQALWSWQTRGEALPAGLWLGFQPQLRDRQVLRAPALRQVWVSGPPPAPLPPGWRATGARGSLQTGVG